MKKRLFTVLLALCLVFALGTVTALADDAVASIGSTQYESLEAAVNAANEGDTIQLIDNISIDSVITIDESITLDLNGHIITNNVEKDRLFCVTASSFTVDGTAAGSVMTIPENNTSSYGFIKVADRSVVTLNGGTYSGNTDNGAFVKIVNDDDIDASGSSVIFNNANMTSNNRFFSTDTLTTDANTSTLQVIGGTYTTTGQAFGMDVLYASPVTFTNATVTAGTGPCIEVCGPAATFENCTFTVTGEYNGFKTTAIAVSWSGTATINGGTYSAIHGYGVYVYNSGGAIVVEDGTVSGGEAAVRADKNVQTENGSLTQSSVTVNGGQTIGDWETDNKDEAVLMLTVTGGTHEEDVNDYIPTGAALTQNESGEIIPNPTVNVVASIDGIGYNSLANAIAAANDGDTVVVLQDTTLTESLAIDKSITLEGVTEGVVISGQADNADINVVVTGEDVTIQDLIFRDFGVDCGTTSGATVIEVPGTATDTTFLAKNLTIDGFCRNAFYFCAGNGTVEDCTITGRNNSDNILVKGISAFGPSADDPVTVFVKNTYIAGVDSNYANWGSSGVEIWEYANVTVENCTIESLSYGVTLADGIEEGQNSNVWIRGDQTSIDALEGAVSVQNWNSHAPSSGVYVEAGTFVGPVGLTYHNDSGAYQDEGFDACHDMQISGGSYDRSVAEYVVPELNYEAHADELYTYHETLEEALATGGTVRSITAAQATDDNTATVTLVNGSVRSTVVYVSGEEITLPTLNRNGYTFGGWRGGDGTTYRGGQTVEITRDTTFTAIWNAINIPDTYDIELIVGEGGEASTSLSNASAGSTITVNATPDEGYELDYITVDGERISGTTFTMPDHDVTVRVYFTDGSVDMPFVDVNSGDWFYDEVAYVYANGLMDGVSTTQFNPNGTMTRAMVWAILARIDGETVTGANWVETARAWAMANGVSDGENANGYVTREQFATMLWRYDGEPASSYSLSAFTDAGSVSDYAETAMAWAVEHGIITGMTDTTIEPQGTATRAQCAAMLMRFVEL